jgi:hypothetical protein
VRADGCLKSNQQDVSATLNFDNDFVTTTNGLSFQFNCYSNEATGTFQQYVIYLLPNDTELRARIDNWSGPNADAESARRFLVYGFHIWDYSIGSETSHEFDTRSKRLGD